MSASINQFGLHTVEYTIRKKRLADPLYLAAHPDALPEPVHCSYAHNTLYDTCTPSSSFKPHSIDMAYADELAKNVWSRPMENSPSMYKLRQGECCDGSKLQHTLELNSPYVPYGGYTQPNEQTKWESFPTTPPKVTAEKQREKFPVVMSSMTKYVEEMNTMEFGFKLY